VTYLIRGAISRPRQITKKRKRISLGICSLGELVDMYHAHEARKRHDKVYALLGMSSDDLIVPGLEPDYNIEWKILMRSLVKFLLDYLASVETWNDWEIAVIKSKGFVLGRVTSIETKKESRRVT
jgi:hypothetical protein